MAKEYNYMLMRRLLVVLALAGLALHGGAQPPSLAQQRGLGDPRDGSVRAHADPAIFAAQIAALSEPPGYFDTDNLISNERSYLEVIPELRRAPGRGAYVGVGPDQNFSYIAAVRPTIAFIVDIRRDNLLLHLLFKALFQLSRTRVEYLALLLARPVPPKVESWRGASIDRLVGYIDSVKSDTGSTDVLRTRVTDVVGRFGIRLSREDLDTIDRFHRRFIESGLDLRFHSSGRPPQPDYPTYRELLVARDPDGKASNYLASEEAFQFVKNLQANDLIIPVVGNLSGPSALARIGGVLLQRGEDLSAFYASNVEFYLFGDGTYRDFVGNLRRIPHSNRSLIIRSVFARDSWRYARAGYNSSSHTQSIAVLLDAVQNGRIRSYRDLIGY